MLGIQQWSLGEIIQLKTDGETPRFSRFSFGAFQNARALESQKIKTIKEKCIQFVGPGPKPQVQGPINSDIFKVPITFSLCCLFCSYPLQKPKHKDSSKSEAVGWGWGDVFPAVFWTQGHSLLFLAWQSQPERLVLRPGSHQVIPNSACRGTWNVGIKFGGPAYEPCAPPL